MSDFVKTNEAESRVSDLAHSGCARPARFGAELHSRSSRSQQINRLQLSLTSGLPTFVRCEPSGERATHEAAYQKQSEEILLNSQHMKRHIKSSPKVHFCANCQICSFIVLSVNCYLHQQKCMSAHKVHKVPLPLLPRKICRTEQGCRHQ